MEFIKWLWVCLIMLLVSSCANEVTYESPQFIEKHPKGINVLNNDYMFRNGGSPMVVDSLLITSTGDSEHYVAIFNCYTGKLIKEFGRKGPGPNELGRPTTFSVDKLNRLLYVCDWGKQTLLRYDLRKMFEETTPEYESIQMSDDFMRSSQMCFLKDSLFYAPAGKEGRMLVGLPSSVLSVLKSETADKNKFPTKEDWYCYMDASSVKTVRPDGRYLASASSLGGILEIFDLNSMERVMLKHFYEPIFEQKGHVFRPTPETIGGFMYLAATDKYLYATLQGKVNPTSLPTSICKFDWNGNPIDRYDCGKYAITSFTVTDDDETIYAIAIGEEGEQILLDIKL